jgi:hypothetical protein
MTLKIENFFIQFIHFPKFVKMNRKFIFTLIVGIYLLNSIGIPVYYHYCGGELEKVTALFKTNTCCDGEEEENDSDCCQNVEKILLQHHESRLAEKNVFANNDEAFVTPDLLEFKGESSKFKVEGTRWENEFHLPKKGRNILLDKSVLII